MFEENLFILLFSGIWCLVGGIFLAVGMGMRRANQRNAERRRARATGTVTELVRHVHHDSDGTSVSWHPMVEFSYDGRRIALESPEGLSRKELYEGQQVEILYDPDDPASFEIEGKKLSGLLEKIMIGVGAGCIAIGLIAAVLVKGLVPVLISRFH